MLKARLSDRPPIKKNNENNKKGEKKSRSYKISLAPFKKNVVYILISAFILLLAFSFTVPMFLNFKVWKPEITSFIENYTGKKAFIDGDINFSLYPSPQIIIEEISIFEHQEDKDLIFFSSEKIMAKVSLFSLFKGQLHVDKVVIENINLNLINLRNEDPNWVFKRPEEDNIDTIDKSINFPKIKIKQYEIIDASVNINNNNSLLKFDIIDLEIDAVNNFNTFKGNILFNNIDFSLIGSLNFNNEILDLLLTLNNEDLKIGLDGPLQYSNSFPNFNGKLNIELEDSKYLVEQFELNYLKIINDNTKIDGELEFNFQKQDLFYSLNNINILSGSSILSGVISGNTGEKANLDVVLSSNNLDLDLVFNNLNEYRDLLNFNENTSKNNLALPWSNLNGSLLFSVGTSKLKDYPIRDFVVDLKKEGKSFTLNKGRALFPGNTEIIFKGDFKENLKTFEGSSTLNSENISSFLSWISLDLSYLSNTRLKKSEIESSVVIRKGGATFAGLKGLIDSSKIDGELRLRFDEEKTLIANLKIDKINLDAYLNNKDEKKKESTLKENIIDHLDKLIVDVNLGNLLLDNRQLKNVKLSSSYENQKLTIRKFDVDKFENGNLFINGSINFLDKDPVYDLDLAYENKNIIDVLESFNLGIYIKNLFKGHTTLETKISGKKQSLSSKIFIGNEILDLSYNGSIKFNSLKDMIFDGNINIDIKDFSSYMKNTLINYEHEGSLSANYTSSIFMNSKTLKLNNISFIRNDNNCTGNIDINFLENNIDAYISSNALSVEELLITNNFFRKNLLALKTGNIKLESDKFHAFNNVVNNLSGVINISDNSIAIDNFNGKVFSSKLSFDGNYDEINQVFEGELKLSKLDINLLFDNYFTNNSIFGFLSTDMKLKSLGSNYNEIKNNIIASGKIKLKNIYVDRFDVSAIYNINDSSITEEEFNNQVSNTVFSNKTTAIKDFELKFNILKNKFLLENIKILMDGNKTLLNAEYNFLNNNFEGNLVVPILEGNENEFIIKLWNKESAIIYESYLKNRNFIKTEEQIKSNVIDENKNLEETVKIKESEDKKVLDNILDDLNKTILQKDNEKVEDKIIENNIGYLPNPIVMKTNNKNIEYNEISNIIKNNTVKYKLPTQEELLEDMLDILLDDE